MPTQPASQEHSNSLSLYRNKPPLLKVKWFKVRTLLICQKILMLINNWINSDHHHREVRQALTFPVLIPPLLLGSKLWKSKLENWESNLAKISVIGCKLGSKAVMTPTSLLRLFPTCFFRMRHSIERWPVLPLQCFLTAGLLAENGNLQSKTCLLES